MRIAASLPELLRTYHLQRLPGGERLTVPENWPIALLDQGKALILLDGFDEVPPADREKVSQWISEGMQSYRKSVFIVTSRPMAYRTDFVGRKPRASFWIKDFNEQQRRQFVEQWYQCQESKARGNRMTPKVEQIVKERSESLLAQIKARPELDGIAGNVLLLNMMARFHRDGNGAELPQRKVELYQEICELQLGRRPRAKGIALLLNSLMERQEVVSFVALEMMKGAAHDPEDQESFKQIGEGDLLALLKEKLDQIDRDVIPQDFLQQIVQVSEIMVERDRHIYQFSHLSFQSYLAAYELVRLKDGGQTLLYQHLDLAPKIEAWKDVVLFYGNLINPTGLIQEATKQNLNDLAYQLYRQTDKRLNLSAAERSALGNLYQTIIASRYQQLETYLQKQDWRKADEETERLMLTAVGKEEGQFFSDKDLKEFPCEELKAIDQLWVNHSNGLYGFSVQKDIYVECGGKLDFSYPSNEVWYKFCEAIAWREEGEWKVLWSEILAPDRIKVQGHLPFKGTDTGGHLPFGSWEVLKWGIFFSRIKTCEV